MDDSSNLTTSQCLPHIDMSMTPPVGLVSPFEKKPLRDDSIECDKEDLDHNVYAEVQHDLFQNRDGPNQPDLGTYCPKLIGDRTRNFKVEWFKAHIWLS